jgi:hypothetical protein
MKQAVEKTPSALLRSIDSRQRTKTYASAQIYRTPRIWIFLNSLQRNCSKVISFRQVTAIYG